MAKYLLLAAVQFFTRINGEKEQGKALLAALFDVGNGACRKQKNPAAPQPLQSDQLAPVTLSTGAWMVWRIIKYLPSYAMEKGATKWQRPNSHQHQLCPDAVISPDLR